VGVGCCGLLWVVVVQHIPRGITSQLHVASLSVDPDLNNSENTADAMLAWTFRSSPTMTMTIDNDKTIAMATSAPLLPIQ
jgi:hypothetical protein